MSTSRQSKDSIRKALLMLKAPEPMSMSEWADKYFYLSAYSSSIEGRWESYPYQVGILDWIGSDDIKTFTWRKAARTGYTKSLVISICYNTIHRKRNQVIYQPTAEAAKVFTTREIDPTLLDVKSFGDQLRCKPGKKSSFNT